MSEDGPARPSFRLRRMMIQDLPEVLSIERSSFPNPWPETTFRGELQNVGISFPLVALDPESEAVVGYLIYWKIVDDVQVNNVAVHPDYRRRGVAESMFREILAELRREGVKIVTLEVRMSNLAARRLYEKLGFRRFGIRRGYYVNPDEDALVLGLELSGEVVS
jgi:ribosomal-protein-alanine N-acetyltransferase